MKTTDNGGTLPGRVREGGGRVDRARSRSRPRTRRSSGWARARPTTATARAGATACTARRTPARPGRTRASRTARPSRASSSIPTDPATAWVAAVGDLWTRERASAASTRRRDGGQDLEGRAAGARALRRRRWAAATSPSIPQNPHVLYAALYARQRTPWSFTSGPAAHGRQGPRRHLQEHATAAPPGRSSAGACPAGTGRIGLAVYAKDPQSRLRDRAERRGRARSGIDEVRSRRGGVFRSEDGGESWTRTSPLNPRPFYFSQIRVDPANDKRVYVLGFALHVSEDGGQTLPRGPLREGPPRLPRARHRPARTRSGCSSAPTAASTRASTAAEGWEHLNRMAAGEFYRINVDTSTPYRICGGLQDNLNWVGPSRTRSKDGIVNADWINIGGGDGFYCVFDAARPERRLRRVAGGLRPPLRPAQRADRRTCGRSRRRASRRSASTGTRRSSAAATTKDTLYLAGNRVFKLTGTGEQWQRDQPRPLDAGPAEDDAPSAAAPRTTASSTRSRSRRSQGACSGRAPTTASSGSPRTTAANWTDLTANLPAPRRRGSGSAASRPATHDAKVAYLAVDAHRTGNYAPLAYRTARRRAAPGRPIAGDLPADGPVKVVREDPENPQLLYAGTEFGALREPRPRRALDEARRPAHGGRGRHPRAPARPRPRRRHARPQPLHPRRRARRSQELDGRGRWPRTRTSSRRGRPRRRPPPARASRTGPARRHLPRREPAGGRDPHLLVKEYTGEPVKIAVENAGGRPVANLTAPGTPGLNRVDLGPEADARTCSPSTAAKARSSWRPASTR